MTISSTTNRVDYTGNDTTATYNYTFRIFLQGDLLVTVRNTTTDVESTLAITTDYTVSGVTDAGGGTIVLVDASQAWISASSYLDTGYEMTIRRVAQLTQGTDIRNQGDFYPEVHEDVFDKSIMIDQQQQDELDRTVKLPETVTSSDFDPTLPAALVGTASLALVSNATGTGFETGPTVAAISGAEANAIAAAASAAAAAASAAAMSWNDVSYKTFSDSPITIVDGDAGTFFQIDCTSGNVVVNFPAISALTLTNPWQISFKKSDSSANTITVNRSGTDTIEGATSKVISRQYEGSVFIPDVDGSPDDWSALTFGEVPIDGDIVGTTDTQTLSAKTLTSPVLNTGVSGTAVLDDDTMATATATTLASSESIKAYVDTQLTAEDLDITSDSGTIAIDLDSETLTVAGGTGIDSSAATNTVTLAIDSTVATLTGSQTLTNKSIDSDNCTITNIVDADIKAAAAIDAAKIHDASVSNTEFGYLDGVTSAIQTQMDTKTDTGTANEITLTGTVIGLSDDPVIPGTDSMVVPVGTTAQQVSTTAGALRYNSDTSGFEGYSSGAWSAIGGAGAGSVSQIKLYKANDDGVTDWTAKSIDDVLPDFDGTDTLGATFDASSTGDALLSNDDADAVYEFATTTSTQYDAVGFDLNIPKYIRGRDVLLEFVYRTKDTSGDSANADYMIWVFDQTSGVNTTTTSTGAQAAGSSLVVGTSTGMSVGDKIWIGETGGTTQVTEAHITAIADSTHVTLSEAVTLTSGDRFVTGILTDVLTTLNAADSDTNEVGNTFKKVFTPPEACAQVTIMWQQLTSQTDSFLYFDNVVVDSDPFKMVQTGGQLIACQLNGDDGGSDQSLTDNTNTKVTILDATHDTTNSWDETNNRYNVPEAGWYQCNFTTIVKDDPEDDIQWALAMIYVNGVLVAKGQAGHNVTTATGTVGIQVAQALKLNKDDYIEFWAAQNNADNDASVIADDSDRTFGSIVKMPDPGTSILVESQDSVMTEWTSYTPTSSWTSNISSNTARYRRVGDSIEVTGEITVSGAPNSVALTISLPSGLEIDTAKMEATNKNTFGNVNIYDDSTYTNGEGIVRYLNTTTVTLMYRVTGQQYYATITQALPGTWASPDAAYYQFSVPIAGWSANHKPILALPTITVGQEPEHGFWNTAGGLGSTNTKIPYFSTEVTDTISNLGTVDHSNSTNGFSFTSSARCKVTMIYNCNHTTSGSFSGISLDSAELTTNIESLSTTAPRKAITRHGATNEGEISSWTGIMEPGQVLRPHTSGTATVTANTNMISLLVEPIEGQRNQAAIIAQPVALVTDIKTSGTDGGSSTSSTTQDRDLNTLSGDIASVGVTLSDPSFTLTSGKFKIEFSAPAYNPAQHQALLYNNTDSKIQKHGSCLYSVTGGDVTISSGVWVGTITKSTSFKIKHFTATGVGTNGLGLKCASVTGNDGTEEIYTQVKITRLK